MRPWILGLFVPLVAVSVPAQEPVFESSDEILAPSVTFGDQAAPEIARTSDGGFFVVWRAPDGDGHGVRGRVFGPTLEAVGPDFPINVFTAGSQDSAAVAPALDGGFTVVWESDGQDGDAGSIHARRFDSAGVPQGGELQVNTFTTSYQEGPDVSSAEDGSFVVVWQDVVDGDGYAVQMKLFDSAGMPIGGDLAVNTVTTGSQSEPRIRHAPGGGFVVVWQSYVQAPGRTSVRAQRFDASGDLVGDELQVETTTAQDQRRPDVGITSTGDFVVVWESEQQDGDQGSVHAQRFSSDGARLGGELQVNSWTTGHQAGPRVHVDDRDFFFVVWESEGVDGQDGGLRGRRFDVSGVPVWDEFTVNLGTTFRQSQAAISRRPDGRFAVAWRTEESSGGDSDTVFRTLRPALFADGFESGDTAVWSTPER